MRERGAWVSAVGSACSALLRMLRVFTRPVTGRFSRLGLRSSRAHQAACAPGALAPSPLAGPVVQEGSPMPFLDPPVNLPGGNACRSSLRLATGCGSAGLTAGPRSSRDWLPRRGSRPKPLPRRLERHVDQRPDVLSFGRLQDLPPSGHAQYPTGGEGVG